MRFYIIRLKTLNEQEIINLDDSTRVYENPIDPKTLNGKTIKNCYKDDTGDIVFETY